jgi:hypothetical protein
MAGRTGGRLELVNTDSIDTRKVQHGQMERPGDFCFSPDFGTLYLWLPGVPGPDAIRIHRGSDPGTARHWGWDGNEDKPTVTPSIHCPGFWHGHLRAGRLISC